MSLERTTDDHVHPKPCLATISTYTLTIHGLGSSDENPAEIMLSRSQTFPASRLFRKYVAVSRGDDWAPLSLPNNGAHPEIELTNSISEGRVGLSYSSVKPKYGRSLAREAWFYEQFARESGYEGVFTPRCFGFFTVPLKDCLDSSGQPVSHIKPWENITIKPPEEYYHDRNGEPVQVEDAEWRVPDDGPAVQHLFDDVEGWKSGSPWDTWRSSPSDPLLCHFSSPNRLVGDEDDGLNEEDLNDIRDLVRDMSLTGIIHRDLRICNILRATHDVICPRHGRAHRWRLCDFDMAVKVCVSPEIAFDAAFATRSQVRKIGLVPFWGWA
ncbi:hypothetical protein BDN70DRAFT_903424 [Pholiota conissans]|uniref:Protein kinase domain-containing protein n=1 Tax=Pholiota conissans TaxID=109636 RepID=A0A9P5ZDI0_9AGAR|nr:hypothetical protein BDN70DRAFT_903424 [Pholiota conissans]